MNEQGTELHTQRLLADSTGIAGAAQLIAQGACVAVPTETVYGLAADATNGPAVAGIYAAKGRPSFNPLIVHVPDLAAARSYVLFNCLAEKLAAVFWPGPLTMVLPTLPHTDIAALVSAGLPTLAIRVPAHHAMQKLLAATGKPLAAPSANASGYLSPTRAEHVLASLEGRIAAVIDDGPCARGLESTIIGFDGDAPVLLRPGAIDVVKIEAVLGRPLATDSSGHITAPGQTLQHYAPRKPLRLNAISALPDEYHIGFGIVPGDISLSLSGDFTEAAANLFAHLHLAETQSRARIAVAPIPDIGLGMSLNDRLQRAVTK
jgi:L-threonylcarbamoyladenylate synthase